MKDLKDGQAEIGGQIDLLLGLNMAHIRPELSLGSNKFRSMLKEGNSVLAMKSENDWMITCWSNKIFLYLFFEFSSSLEENFLRI